MPFELGLVLLDLPLLLLLLLLLSLELVADEGAGSESKGAAYCRPRPGTSDSGADKATRSGTAEGSDACAFLPCGQWGGTCQGSQYQWQNEQCHQQSFHSLSFLSSKN
ncbi:MAG: hypothetical protein AAB070_02480 [Candidatus Binatota bacterium]